MLLNVLVLGIFIDLLINLLRHPLDLLSLLPHLFSILCDADTLVVKPFLFLVHGELLGLLVRIHLGLLGCADFVESSLALLNDLLELSELVTLAGFQACDVLI